MVLHMARMATNLAEHVTIYCHGNAELEATLKKTLEGKGVTVEGRKLTAVESFGEGLKVHLEDGACTEERFLVRRIHCPLYHTRRKE